MEMSKAYAFLWEQCNTVESCSDFLSKVEGEPTELFKGCKRDALNFPEDLDEMTIIAHVMKMLVDSRQNGNKICVTSLDNSRQQLVYSGCTLMVQIERTNA